MASAVPMIKEAEYYILLTMATLKNWPMSFHLWRLFKQNLQEALSFKCETRIRNKNEMTQLQIIVSYLTGYNTDKPNLDNSNFEIYLFLFFGA